MPCIHSFRASSKMAETLHPARGAKGMLGRAGYSQLPEEGRQVTEGKAKFREQFLTWLKSLCKKQMRSLQTAKQKLQARKAQKEERETWRDGTSAREAGGGEREKVRRVRPASMEPEDAWTKSSSRVDGRETPNTRHQRTGMTPLRRESHVASLSTPAADLPASLEQEVGQLTRETSPAPQDGVVAAPRVIAVPDPRYQSTMAVPASPVLRCPDPGRTRPSSTWRQSSSAGLDPRPASDLGLSEVTRLTAVVVLLLGKELVATTGVLRRCRSFRRKSSLPWMPSVEVSSIPRVDTKGLCKASCPHKAARCDSPRQVLDLDLLERQLGSVDRMLTLLRQASQSVSLGDTQAPVEEQKRTVSRDPWYLRWFGQYGSSVRSFTMGFVAGLVFSFGLPDILHCITSSKISRRPSVGKVFALKR